MTVQKTAAVFGATGLIGQKIVRRLLDSGWIVRVFAREPDKSRALLTEVEEHYSWDYEKDDWKTHLAGTDAVINFSGAPIFKKWKGDYKRRLVDSRVKATRKISQAICDADRPPSVFINGSAAGIYGYDSFDDKDVNEDDQPGTDFWGELVTAWEKAANEAEKCGTRVVNIRTSVVLSMDSGALPQLVSVFNKGIGGPIRPGDQWFPWIHIEDEVGLIMFALNKEEISGPINACAPEVPNMKEFARTLGHALGKPSRIPIPITILRLMMGEVSNVLANGKKVVPARALELGYEFHHPKLEEALTSLVQKPGDK